MIIDLPVESTHCPQLSKISLSFITPLAFFLVCPLILLTLYFQHKKRAIFKNINLVKLKSLTMTSQYFYLKNLLIIATWHYIINALACCQIICYSSPPCLCLSNFDILSGILFPNPCIINSFLSFMS